MLSVFAHEFYLSNITNFILFFFFPLLLISGFGNELKFDAKKSSDPPNAVNGEQASPNGSLTPDLFHADDKPMTPNTFESEDGYPHSEDESARSPLSPAGRGAMESPSQESDGPFGRNSEADAETHRSVF